MLKVHQYGIMSAPTTAQDAALGRDRRGRGGRRADARRVRPPPRLIVDGLNALGLETFEPRGAFYAFPRSARRVSTTRRSPRACSRRSGGGRARVCVRAVGAGHVRMCYATSYEQLEEALRRIGSFVERVRAA
jgi:aminotransferase